VEHFYAVPVLVIYGIVKLNDIAVPAKFGLTVSIIEAGINSLIVNIEILYT
jgi:hypothetical protein